MSLINKMNAVKNKLGGIDKVTYAKLYTETGIDNVIIIELNGIFKLIEIDYTGQLQSFISTHKRLNVQYNHNKITITNKNKVSFKNNITLKYNGIIHNFYKCLVYGWGQGHLPATLVIPSMNKSNIGKNENIVSENSETMLDREVLDYGI